MDWCPVQTYGIWGFGPAESGSATTTVSRGVSADALGRVFACFGTTFPPHTFVAVCCDQGRVVRVPLRLGHGDDDGEPGPRPLSVTVSPDGEWLYVLDDAGAIWRLAARRTGEWGEPQRVRRPSRTDAEVWADDDDPVLHDQSMLCTGDALYYWRHDLCFVRVPLTAAGTGVPRVVHSAEWCAGLSGERERGGIRWWMLAPGENALLYEGESMDATRVDLTTGEETPVVPPPLSVSPVSGWSIGEDGVWVGTSDALELRNCENALFAFGGGIPCPPSLRSTTPLIGGVGIDVMQHASVHDATAPGEPSTVGHVRHAAVDARGQLWLLDTRCHTVNGEPYEDDVSCIALRCVRPPVGRPFTPRGGAPLTMRP